MRQGMCLPRHMSRRATDDDTCRGIQSLACRAPQIPGNPREFSQYRASAGGGKPHTACYPPNLSVRQQSRGQTAPASGGPRQYPPSLTNHVQLPGTALLSTRPGPNARAFNWSACTGDLRSSAWRSPKGLVTRRPARGPATFARAFSRAPTSARYLAGGGTHILQGKALAYRRHGAEERR
jgi:hypothetical protein